MGASFEAKNDFCNKVNINNLYTFLEENSFINKKNNFNDYDINYKDINNYQIFKSERINFKLDLRKKI